VYSSPNAVYLPQIPDIRAKFHEESNHPRDLRNLRWFSNTSPHWAFVPRFPRFDNPIFERLIYSYRNLPIVRSGGWYFLEPQVQQQWWRLEMALRWVANVILSSGAALLSLGFNAGPYPSSYGYTRNHTEERFARYCAMKARDAFVPLMALCTFAISTTKQSIQHQTANHVPKWVEMLQAEQEIHPSWIEDFSHSAAANLSETVGRIGAFIDVSTYDMANFTDVIIRANVPIWFYWGNKRENPRPHHKSLARFKPHIVDVQSNAPLYQPDVAPLNIRLPHGSRQRSGETWRMYFEHIMNIRADQLLRESAEHKARREQRETKNSSFLTPTRNGAPVFYWEEHLTGFRIRTRVPHRDVYEIWGRYANSQKRYDSLVDEWDICTEFDPDAIAPDYDDDEDDDIDAGTPFQTQQLQTHAPDTAVWEEVSPNYQQESLSASIQDTGETFDNIVCYRYGLSIPPGLYQRLNLVSQPELKDTRRILANERAPLLDAHLAEAIRDLVQCLIDIAKGPAKSIPSSLWDLNQHNHRYLSSRRDLVISIREKDTDQGIVYLLTTNQLPPERNVQWTIVLEDAATALECVRRRWGPHFIDVANELYTRGYPFSTRLVGPQPLTTPRPAINILGYRPKGYNPLPCDYAAYEALRDSFLATPRARAALLKGGIVWRLAKEVVPEVTVVNGPSSESLLTGRAFRCDEQYLWDDELTEEELNLICGVYKVQTGK
jgi:hypothetical protein